MTNKLDTIEIIAPPVEIIPNKPSEPHKRLTLKRLHEETTIYKIGDNFIKKISLGNYTYEYIVNNIYGLKMSDYLTAPAFFFLQP